MDLSFHDRETFERYSGAEALVPASIGALFDVDAAQIKFFLVPDLAVVKISYPRRHPQGGALERDMHRGQEYVRLPDVALEQAH